jgi:hypothetical protein
MNARSIPGGSQRSGCASFPWGGSAKPRFTEEEVAGVAGLEPVTSAVTGQRSNQLSYTPAQGQKIVEYANQAVKPSSVQKKCSDDRRQGGGGGEPR